MGMKITIAKDGPYIVTGNVPLKEYVITPDGSSYKLVEGRQLPRAETYALCRCGRSKNAPFCDGSHVGSGFGGTERAGFSKYDERCDMFEGEKISLLDDGRCAFARFCHQEGTTVWNLLDEPDSERTRSAIIRGSEGCVAGRLTAVDSERHQYEPELEPAILILQDPEKGVSAGIAVQGGIEIVSADGRSYETRNRVALCRCGHSSNQPLCDGTHAAIGYTAV